MLESFNLPSMRIDGPTYIAKTMTMTISMTILITIWTFSGKWETTVVTRTCPSLPMTNAAERKLIQMNR